MASPGELDDADLFDFVDEFHRDRDRGQVQPLTHYLRRYPGRDEALAREYSRLVGDAREPEPEPVAADGSGRRIGPYRLLRELGSGGQGAVWLAEDTRIARQVALKFMPSSFALLSADRRRRFQREAEVVSRLEHPSICPIYEAQVEHDPPYIAMRAIDGETLASVISRARAGQRHAEEPLPLPPRDPVELRRVLAFFERAARALHAAHEAGVVHRDIKPGNVMVTRAGEPVLLDFGQARDERAELHERTLSGEVFGTPAYMSPEQVEGSSNGVDRRTDVWSLGASLYEALTLHRPFLADSVAALLHAIRTEPLPNPRGRGRALDEDTAVVLETALEKDVARRYASALELAEDLRRVREYEPIHARPAGPLLKLRRWAQRHPALAVACAAVAIALSGAAWLAQREADALEREGAALRERGDALQRELEARQREDLALDNVLGRYLAMRSADLLSDDPAAALALGLRAVDRAPGYATRSALFAALERCWLDSVLVPSKSQIVTDLDLSPDGRFAFGALNDGNACVWDLARKVEMREFTAATAPLQFLRVDPRGQFVVTLSQEPALAIWRVDDLALVARVEGPGKPWCALEIVPTDGAIVALATDGQGLIVEPGDGRVRARLALEPQRYNRVRAAPDGGVLLVSSAQPARPNPLRANQALLLDPRDGHVLATLAGHGDAITDSDVAPDSRAAVTVSLDGTARLWSLPGGQPLGEPMLHAGPLSSVHFTLDGAGIVTGAEGSGSAARVRLWDLATRTSRSIDDGRGDRVQSIDVRADDGELLIATRDPSLLIASARGGPPRALSERLRPVSARWALGGRRILTHALAPYALVWWAESRPDIYSLAGHTAAVTHAELSPDGSSALTLSEDGTARLWHAPNRPEERPTLPIGAELARMDGATVASFAIDGRALVGCADGTLGWLGREGWTPLRGRLPARPRELAHEPGGDRALVLAEGGVAFLIEPGGEPRRLRDEVRALAWTGRGSCALALDGQRLARIDDVGSRELAESVLTWSSPHGSCEALRLAAEPNQRALAVACADGRLRLFGRETARERDDTLDLFVARDVQFAPGGQYLLAIGAAGRGVARLIDLARDKPIPDRVMHTAPLTGGDFHFGGQLALTCSRDRTVYLREVATGEPVARRTDFPAEVTCSSFSRDGGEPRVISGCADGSVHVWPVDPTAAARARLPRELFAWEEERERRFAAPLPFR